ncbi:MAG: hypothetical protein AAF927_14455 [Bacteroidota bacterium]
MKTLNENQLQMLNGGDIYEPGSAGCGAASAFLIGMGTLAGGLVGGPIGAVLGGAIMGGLASSGPC